jgi:hypothetical protein
LVAGWAGWEVAAGEAVGAEATAGLWAVPAVPAVMAALLAEEGWAAGCRRQGSGISKLGRATLHACLASEGFA